MKHIDAYSPDLIISVHPFGSGVLGKMRRKGLISCRAIALITDFTARWVHVGQGIDRYIVASDALKNSLVKKGVDSESIRESLDERGA